MINNVTIMLNHGYLMKYAKALLDLLFHVFNFEQAMLLVTACLQHFAVGRNALFCCDRYHWSCRAIKTRPVLIL